MFGRLGRIERGALAVLVPAVLAGAEIAGKVEVEIGADFELEVEIEVGIEIEVEVEELLVAEVQQYCYWPNRCSRSNRVLSYSLVPVLVRVPALTLAGPRCYLPYANC